MPAAGTSVSASVSAFSELNKVSPARDERIKTIFSHGN